MRRFLIVGNQSLGSRELQAAVEERVAEGPCQFHIVVPATPPHDHLYWTEGEANVVARRRLEDALDALRMDDTAMTGAIGDANPLLAVTDALASGEFDEIILSTLPPGMSRWIRQDLDHRLARRTSLPVHHVASTVRETQEAR
jgi:GABA permease